MAGDTFALLLGVYSRHSRSLGLFLSTVVGFLFTVSFACVQLIFHNHSAQISPLQIMFFRSAPHFPMAAAVMFHQRIHPFGKSSKDVGFFLTLGACSFLDVYFAYEALDRIPVADHTAISLIKPVMTFLVSFLIAREHCNWREVVCGILGCLGVVIVCRPTFLFHVVEQMPKIHGDENNPVPNATFSFSEVGTWRYIEGVCFSISGSFMTAIFYVLVKWTGKTSDGIFTVFYPSLVSILLIPIVMLTKSERFFIEFSANMWIKFGWISLASYFAIIFASEALQLENATHCMLMRNLDIVYAVLLQFLFMGLLPNWTTVIGALVILVSSTALTLQRMLLENKDNK